MNTVRYQEELENIKRSLSESRKANQDVKIAELLTIKLPAKIQLAEATGDPKDEQQLRQLIEQIKKEIHEESIKTPVPENPINVLVQSIDRAMSENRRDDALASYRQLRQQYNMLPASEKLKHRQEGMRIHKLLSAK